jgi:hypothetical protein
MVVVVDFDGTIVQRQKVGRPLELMPGVEHGLASLKAAGHVLLLCSARANRARRFDPSLDPLVCAGVRKVDLKNLERDQARAQERYQEMLDFVAAELPDFFDAIDDGSQGKPVADLYIDDRALSFNPHGLPGSMSWEEIAELHGDPSRIDELFEEIDE